MNSKNLLASLLLSLVALLGCSREESDERAPAAASAGAESASDVPGVTADAATQRGLGVELAAVATASVEAQARGTATVIDSAAFASSMADLESLRAEVAVATENQQRLQNLYQDGGNASRQAVDAAIQQNASARAKLAGSESRARLDWGMKLASAADAASARLRADVVSGAVTLFHAEFPGRLGVANTLHYELLNARGAPVVLEFIDRSRTPAQFAAGDSALLALRAQSATGVSFRPNERVPIVATTFGSARAFVPAAAALAYQGRLWCYVARSTDRFERVPLDSEASSTEGYAAGESIKAGDQVVVRGAALLLSLERSASSDVGSSTDE
ncbi:MAG TPA: hypothetical protein VL494_00635 [Steroidobacteraceae bacterium]|jgi:hypothetical protein|nr:hypothetical protein [Steroidobacteraceae bacterium]